MMCEENALSVQISIVQVEERWRIFVDGMDQNASFQYPWDALQCALNGSLSGRPMLGVEQFDITCRPKAEDEKLSKARETEIKQRELLAALQGLHGDGI
jgi:hypothetical protein